MKIKYMHTLDGQPAFFDTETQQIFFAGSSKHNAVILVDSVKSIHRNERASKRTRKHYLDAEDNKFLHSWVKVAV